MTSRIPAYQCTDAEWKQIQRDLRAVCPPPSGWSWRFYRSRALKDSATCSLDFKKKEIVIKVRRGYCEEYTRELVAHEAAHGLAWQHSPHIFAANHDQTWAQVFIPLRAALIAAKYGQLYHAMFTDRD